MSGFRFRFETLLKVRRSRRDLCRQLLAQVMADHRRHAEQSAALESTRTEQMEQIRNLARSGNIDVDGVTRRRYFARQLEAEKAVLDQQYTILSQQLDLCRQALTKADQEVKVLERLQDRQKAQFDYKRLRTEALEREDAWLSGKLSGAAEL